MCAFDIRRRGELVDAVGARIEAPYRAPDGTALAGGVRSLENEHGRLALFVGLATEFTQLRLEFLFLLRVLAASKTDGQVEIVEDGQRL